jgi:hypothetical protein
MREYHLGELNFNINVLKFECVKEGIDLQLVLNERNTGETIHELYTITFNGLKRDSIYNIADQKGVFKVLVPYGRGDTLVLGSRSYITRYFKFD